MLISRFSKISTLYKVVTERLTELYETKIIVTNTCFFNFFIILFGNIINEFFSVLCVKNDKKKENKND